MSHHANVIVADPPWPFGDKLPGPKRGAEKHYKVMSLDEIKTYLEKGPLAGLVEENAMLVLWRVGSQQQEALDVVKAWGFVAKSELVWIKTKPGTPDEESEESLDDPKTVKMGMGHYVRNEHEVALICTRGKTMFKVADRGVRSTFRAPRGEHSEKPDKFFELIEKLAGPEREGHLVELFGRKARPGWHVFGDEIDCGPNAPKSSYVWTPRSVPASPNGLNEAIQDAAANTSSEVLPAPSTNTSKDRLPLGTKLTAWDKAALRAHEYEPPDDDDEGHSFPPEATTAPAAPKAKRTRKKKGEPEAEAPAGGPTAPEPETPKRTRKAGAGQNGTGNGEAETKAEAAVAPSDVPASTKANGTDTLSESTSRAAFILRAVRERLITEAEAKNPAEAWVQLQYRAPTDWFREGPWATSDLGTPLSAEKKPAENWSALAKELTANGAPITLIALCEMIPFRRDVLRAWLDDGAKPDELPEWYPNALSTLAADAAASLATGGAWAAAKGRLDRWEADGSPGAP